MRAKISRVPLEKNEMWKWLRELCYLNTIYYGSRGSPGKARMDYFEPLILVSEALQKYEATQREEEIRLKPALHFACELARFYKYHSKGHFTDLHLKRAVMQLVDRHKTSPGFKNPDGETIDRLQSSHFNEPIRKKGKHGEKRGPSDVAYERTKLVFNISRATLQRWESHRRKLLFFELDNTVLSRQQVDESIAMFLTGLFEIPMSEAMHISRQIYEMSPVNLFTSSE